MRKRESKIIKKEKGTIRKIKKDKENDEESSSYETVDE